MKRNHPVYGTAAWRQVRAVVLERAGYLCQIGLPGCKGRATQADHIVELEEGGEWYALANLQAACRSCNVAKRNTRVGMTRTPVRAW